MQQWLNLIISPKEADSYLDREPVAQPIQAHDCLGGG